MPYCLNSSISLIQLLLLKWLATFKHFLAPLLANTKKQISNLLAPLALPCIFYLTLPIEFLVFFSCHLPFNLFFTFIFPLNQLLLVTSHILTVKLNKCFFSSEFTWFWTSDIGDTAPFLKIHYFLNSRGRLVQTFPVFSLLLPLCSLYCCCPEFYSSHKSDVWESWVSYFIICQDLLITSQILDYNLGI